MFILNVESIILLHEEIIKYTGGSSEIRDRGLLEAAVNAPNQTFDNAEFYATIEEKAARLGCGLIQNHAFADGNKRIGTAAMLLMLKANEIQIKYSEDDLFNIIMKVAGAEAGYDELYNWIINARDLAK